MRTTSTGTFSSAKPILLAFIAVLSLGCATFSSFSQTTNIWTGGDGTGREIGAGTNWHNGIPPMLSDTAMWDGTVAGPLDLVYNTSVLTSGFGTSGINLYLSGDQTGPVSIDTESSPTSANLPIWHITIEEGAGQLTIGGTNASHRLSITARPAGVVHEWVNNSTNAAIINPQVIWQAGGGATWTMHFAGTGNWICENYLVNSAGPSMRVNVSGPGTMTWVPTGQLGLGGISSPIIIDGGTMILKGSHPRIHSVSSLSWIIDGSFIFDATNAPTSEQTLAGNISGSGTVQVNNGTLTLSGANTYSGGTYVSGGVLFAGDGGANASLGTGSVTNDGVLAFNHSSNQLFTNAISGSGSIVKIGSGSLTLFAANTYSGMNTVSNGALIINSDNSAGATVVYGGVLGGTGTLSGPVILHPESMFAPGASIGIFTINNDLSIAGNITIEVDKSLPVPNDQVVVSGTLTNAGVGPVTMKNFGPPLTIGDTFTLFNKPLQNGASMAVEGAGVIWTNNLEVDGSVSVIGFVPAPTLNYTNSSSALELSWSGSFKLQSQTNSLGSGLGTNWIDYPGGNISPVNIPVGTDESVFFRLISHP